MAPRSIPKKLGEKLRRIRQYKGWTQDRMAEAVGRTEASRRARVWEWEHGIRQPDLHALLAYARLVDVPLEALVDDQKDLDLEDESE